MGRMTSVTDAKNRATAYEYTYKGNISKMTDPLNGMTTYTYGAANNCAPCGGSAREALTKCPCGGIVALRCAVPAISPVRLICLAYCAACALSFISHSQFSQLFLMVILGRIVP